MNGVYRVLLLLAVVGLRRYWLLQPLPSRLGVQDAVFPKLPTIAYDAIANTTLQSATKLFEGRILGVESVAVDADTNTMHMLDRYGNYFTAPVPPKGSTTSPELTPAGYLGPGRPLGFHLIGGNTLAICDSLKGLTALDLASGQLTILANRASLDSPIAPGTPINYANDLDVSANGDTVYFTDASAIPPALNRAGFYDTMMSYLLTAMQGGATGRVLVHRPAEKSTHVLASGLWFPNGVALAADESFLLVAETCSERLLKVWLTGPHAGTTEVLLDGLPGYPDGVARASDGTFWVAIIIKDLPLLRAVAAGGRYARWVVSWLLQVASPPMRRWGMVMRVSGEGEVLQVLTDPTGEQVAGVSGVAEAGGRLYMGHLSGNYVSFIDL